MAPWKISESTAQLTEKEEEVKFTVTNDGPEQDRSVLTIEPQDGAVKTWFTVDEPQRAVPPGATAVYVVELNVPPETPPATYAFEALVYSADRDPGETSARSKRITLTKAAPPPPEGLPKWLIPAIVAVVVLVGGVVGWLLLRGDKAPAPKNVEKPVITGTPEVAQPLKAGVGVWKNADKECCVVQWQRCNGAGEECLDIPGAGGPEYKPSKEEDVGHKLRILVTASNGSRTTKLSSDAVGPIKDIPSPLLTVPNVVGKTASKAKGTLSEFQVVVLANGAGPADCDPEVLGQDPAAGKQLAKGSKVVLVSRPYLKPFCHVIDLPVPDIILNDAPKLKLP